MYFGPHNSVPVVSEMLNCPCGSSTEHGTALIAELAGELLFDGSVKAGVHACGLLSDSPQLAIIGVSSSGSSLRKRDIACLLVGEFGLGSGV